MRHRKAIVSTTITAIILVAVMALAGACAPVPPIASFTADKTTLASEEQIKFTDNSTGEIVSWSWDFGDGNTSTDQNPSHSYTERGNYTVSLTVSNKGGSDTDTLAITVLVPVVANFSVPETKIKTGSSIQFIDECNGDVYSWSWDFGDGSTSTEQSPLHTYKDPGTYTVSLTVSNAVSSDTREKKDYITVTSFIIRRLVMCSNVTEEGEWTPQPEATYHVGDVVWLYLDVIGFEQQKTGEMDEIWVQWTRLRFIDPSGKSLIDASDVGEIHTTVQHTIGPYVWFHLIIGQSESTDPLGEYKVEVTVKDMLSGDTATESTIFILE